MNEKIDNSLNLAMDIPEESLLKTNDLQVGFEENSDTWELIVRYQGNLENVKNIDGVVVRQLSNNYAIFYAPKDKINQVASLDNIIFIEKPKQLYYSVIRGKRASCINEVQLPIEGAPKGLYGKDIIVGIIDSGIDFTHPAFRKEDGTTRILKMWDQVTNKVYSEGDINIALESDSPYEIINSRDFTGHGTHVAGIAAGNFADNKNNNIGIATQSSLVIVKMSTPSDRGFPRTTQLMEGLDFIVSVAREYNMPSAINISFGNSYGSHDGTSLLDTFINSVADGNRTAICVGAGNEGDSGGHTSGVLESRETVEISVSKNQGSFSVQLWKNYADDFQISITSPSGEVTQINNVLDRVDSYNIGDSTLYALVASPKPYTRYQEIYFEIIPNERYIESGIWGIDLTPINIVVGNYDMWLPDSGALNINTRFLKPDPNVTITIPSTSDKVITVGAYNSSSDTVATFSGRGYTRETNQVKPDLVAPGVNINSANVGGGMVTRSGTSMATPFVTGSAALMLQWGIVFGNDPYLYGEKLKANLIRGARKLSEFNSYPNRVAGWGALCLRDSLN